MLGYRKTQRNLTPLAPPDNFITNVYTLNGKVNQEKNIYVQ